MRGGVVVAVVVGAPVGEVVGMVLEVVVGARRAVVVVVAGVVVAVAVDGVEASSRHDRGWVMRSFRRLRDDACKK